LPASQFSNCKFTQHQQAVQSISLQPSFNLTFLQTEFTLENIQFIASELWTKLNHYKVWAFDAEMGAGKTTFIHALCNVLKVADTVGSPTFSIINQYQTQSGNAIFHLDLYRIKDEEEAIQAGIEDVLYSDDLCLVEWPGKINSLLPADTVFIKIDILNSNTRRITIQYPN
jgi:tRNA threonylcarbamoyladenosine biosynthesis protein TsaE